MLLRYVKLWPWPVTLTLDLLTLKVRGTSSVTWSKSVQNLSEIEHFRLNHRRSQGAQWVHLHQRRKKFRQNLQGKVVSAPEAEQESVYRACFCWSREIWRVGVVHLVVFAYVLRAIIQKGPQWKSWLCLWVELLIILLIFAHVMSRRDLDLWPLDLELLQHFCCHAFKLRTKCERTRIIHGWVIDDLARFSRTILGGGSNWQTFLKGAWTQLHQTSSKHRAIITALHFCFRILISCCIFKRGRLKVEWSFKRRQISHFLTPC